VSSEPVRIREEVRTLGGRALGLDPAGTTDAQIARIADAQHGVISSRQLRACGLGHSAIAGRVRRGRLHRLHRGVYTPGHHRLPPLGRVAAAVLACGPGAVTSHLTAAWLHALRTDSRALIDVTVATRNGRRHGRLVTHSAAALRTADATVIDGIPVTSVARTLLDCAPLLGRRGTEKLCLEARRRHVLDAEAIDDLARRVGGHRGTVTLAAAIADATRAKGVAEPGDEDRLLVAFRGAGLPEPECNAWLRRPDGGYARADFLWRAERLIVEADSAGYHDHTLAYRGDRVRDRQVGLLGYETMRFCDTDMRDPPACAAEVAERLALRRPR
jgi:predicted transcriptional regulator of viral defense system